MNYRALVVELLDVIETGTDHYGAVQRATQAIEKGRSPTQGGTVTDYHSPIEVTEVTNARDGLVEGGEGED